MLLELNRIKFYLNRLRKLTDGSIKTDKRTLSLDKPSGLSFLFPQSFIILQAIIHYQLIAKRMIVKEISSVQTESEESSKKKIKIHNV